MSERGAAVIRTVTFPSNLPIALNRFVGREHELQEVKDRLAQARLLTLLGAGGTGKTRLALQAAAGLLDRNRIDRRRKIGR